MLWDFYDSLNTHLIVCAAYARGWGRGGTSDCAKMFTAATGLAMTID